MYVAAYETFLFFSCYMALSGESLESLVKPELREAFEANKAHWFPRTDTSEHRAYDKGTPGLFKEEWQGDGIIGLASKTYYCYGAKEKFSCKGVSKGLTQSIRTNISTSSSLSARAVVLIVALAPSIIPCTRTIKCATAFLTFTQNVKSWVMV